MMKNRRRIWVIFLVIQIALFQVLRFFPEFVERFYSNGLYPIISKFSRMILGWVPVSVGDLIYFIVGFLLLKWIINLFRKPKNWRIIFLEIGAGLSVFYFLFHLLWATNYYREPLFEKMNIDKEYSDADLLRLTNQLIQLTNATQVALTNDPKAKVISNLTQEQIFEKSVEGYENAAKIHSFLNYKNASIKKSLISIPLSYMGFAGYLNPFTNEAQVNDRVPIINFPFTVCHEMAHQIGYASESEANFIGFLAVTQNENLHFKYAGYSNALLYCLGNWQVRNPELALKLLDKINPGTLQNYEDARTHWMQYEGIIEDGSKSFYDTFLKANQQQDGLESYSKFLNLLVNYSKNNRIDFKKL